MFIVKNLWCCLSSIIHHFILVNVLLLHILITSDQFVNIVYKLLLYLIYLTGLSEINELKLENWIRIVVLHVLRRRFVLLFSPSLFLCSDVELTVRFCHYCSLLQGIIISYSREWFRTFSRRSFSANNISQNINFIS